jgi:hypothetical protein
VHIAMFGGSTMFGWGNRDTHTIPSQVWRMLAEKGVPARVENHAHIGYVSSQEAIAVTLLLRDPAWRPDVVVFLDGLNDVESAVIHGHGGVTYEHTELQNLQLTQSGYLWSKLLQLSAFKQWQRRGLPPPSPALDPEKASTLVKEIVRSYSSAVTATEALGTQLGFATLFYWQPTFFSKKSLTPHEKKSVEWIPYTLHQGHVFAAANRDINNAVTLKSFKNLSSLFDEDPLLAYSDGRHYDDRASGVLARRIADDILTALEQKTPAQR